MTSFSAPLDIRECLLPGAFPHEVAEIRLRETNISWVILTGKFAYKIKKPVKLDFLDTTQLERRRSLCETELRLNRRLAAQLYCAVVPITRDSRGVHVDGTGTPIEYAVRMRQFFEGQVLSELLEHGSVDAAEIGELAQRLAEFHATAPRDAGTGADYLARLRGRVRHNLSTLELNLAFLQDPPQTQRCAAWILNELRELESLFERRHRESFIRECHGDLHAGNIVRWEHRLVPFDCLEFDPQLRWIDSMNDVAFLIMDLVSHDRRDLAYGLLDRYAECTGDYGGLRLIPFYAVHAALVRAMVDAIEAAARPDKRASMLERLHRRIHTAQLFSQPPAPMLIIMHGLSGSGKSWLSARLAAALGAVRMRSDVERKRLAAQDDHGGSDLYSGLATDRTYARLLEGAESCLRGGLDAIVDAAFLEHSQRHRFELLAQRLGVPFRIVACEADVAEMKRRIAARRSLHNDPSDADAAVLDQQLAHRRPLEPGEEQWALHVNTRSEGAEARLLTALKTTSRPPPGSAQARRPAPDGTTRR